ncbi:MAG: chromate transporter [Bacteroidales bacterium]|jgi:chromate transporter|nr:chromate transporter [Bacteroidales bacterium]
MIYLQLFLSYLKIGFFGFGGGYAMISLIQNEIVVKHNWLSAMELTDIVAISQMTPGPIAINCATYVGYTVTGNVWGSLLATFAVCLPPLTIMTAITIFYRRLHNNHIVKSALTWMRPVMTGMIGAAALMFLNRETFVDWVSIVIFAVSFVAIWKKFNPILLLVLAAMAGILIY